VADQEWKADDVHRLQAAGEGIKITGSVTFRGKRYRLGAHGAENLMPQLAFAQAADSGLSDADPAGLAAMYEMIRGCFIMAPACGTCEACDDERFDECPAFDAGDWPRFKRVATAVCAGGDEILKVVQQAMEQITARPTSAGPGSSPPEPPPSANSKDPYSSLPAAFRALPDGDLINVGKLARSPD
jgi:hypothetical protein